MDLDSNLSRRVILPLGHIGDGYFVPQDKHQELLKLLDGMLNPLVRPKPQESQRMSQNQSPHVGLSPSCEKKIVVSSNPWAYQMSDDTPKNNDLTEIVVVLDRSRSMKLIAKPTVAAYNKFMDEQAKLPGEAFVTLVTFSFPDRIETVYRSVPVADAKIDPRHFAPEGNTALHDAIAYALKLPAIAVGPQCKRILVVLTDGEENASQQFPLSKEAGLAVLVYQERLKGLHTIFLGANINAEEVGKRLGFEDCQTFAATDEGVMKSIAHASRSASVFRSAK